MIPRATALRTATSCVAVLSVISLTACATPLERAWSLSQRAHAAQMTANPEAGADDLEAQRPDGISTDAALSRYRSQETEVDLGPAPPVINVDIGSR